MSNLSRGNTRGLMPRPVEMVDYLDGELRNDIARDILQGLTAPQKYIPCKYFYDASGSKLFEDICGLPEYYPTRTELSILRAAAPRLMATSAHNDLVELGSGASLKIRTLLDGAGPSNRATLRYVPVDISESAVLEASHDLLERYPELSVVGVVADFTSQLDFLVTERTMMLCFLGSTIGNMDEDESTAFLHRISQRLKPDDTLLVGFDMVKDKETIECAYNDSRGVTAEFNRNVLSVVNRQLEADFDPCTFDHLAFFNEREGRIEMHLRANSDCTARIRSIGLEVSFRKGETIHTENSRKYSRENIEALARQAGLCIRDWHSDSSNWFSLVLMQIDPGKRGNDAAPVCG